MQVRDLYDIIDAGAPFRLQAAYDNAGLILGSPDDEVHGVLLCLDVVHETVEEAARLGANLVLSHHPPIFRAIKRLDPQRHASILAAIRMDMDLLAAHTNFDAAPCGLDAFIVDRLGLTDVQILELHETEPLLKVTTFVPPDFREALLEAMFAAGAGHTGAYSHTSFSAKGVGGFLPEAGTHPFLGREEEMTYTDEDRVETIVPAHALSAVLQAVHEAHPYEEPAIDVLEEKIQGRPFAGFGHVGNLPHSMAPGEFVAFVKSFFDISVLPVAGNFPDRIGRIAFCSGAGSTLVPLAQKVGADVFITGDVTYHPALDIAQTGGCVAIIDHYSTERFFGPAMEQLLRSSDHAEELPPLYQSRENYQPVHLW